MRCLLCRCTARQSRKPLKISFVPTADRWLMQESSTTGKKSLYHAAAGRDKQLRELYAEGEGFSTGGGGDKMKEEGMAMRIRTWRGLVALFAAAPAGAGP